MGKKHTPLGYKEGPIHPFITSIPQPSNKLTRFDYFLLISIIALATIIRLYKIYKPPRVVFDEVHFGTFSLDYYLGEFFLDVHPPLGKLIYYWVAIVNGWNGEFTFEEIGKVYDDNVPYVAMRLVSGIAGVLTAVFTFLTVRLNCRSGVAWIAALLIMIENSQVTQSRFILLDTPLICAQSIVIYQFKKFSQTANVFSKTWFTSLLLTGIALGLTISIKLTGLYTMAWVGILTVLQLWTILGDLQVTTVTWFMHVVVRAICLIIVPITIYLTTFYIHFMTLPYDGTGSAYMSSHFRSTLQDSDLTSMPVQVYYGSTVTIKHVNMEKYLHSHNHTYPTGSKEQQVTMYGYDYDKNNEWMIESQHKFNERLYSKGQIKDGDTIRLYHKNTGKYLHVNDVRPPLSEHEYANEVSCHGDRNLLGDINYEFTVRIVDKKPHSKNNLPLIKLRATESIFQLVHRGTKCVMLSHESKLPEWGMQQNEVLCIDQPTIPNTLWYIEQNEHPNFSETNSELIEFTPFTLWDKVVEYHRAMFKMNRSFTEDHIYSSTPLSWPFVLRGVAYFGNESFELLQGENRGAIYILGNMVIYYVGVLLMLLCGVKYVWNLFWYLNPFVKPQQPRDIIFYINIRDSVLGWILHYFPAFFMSRKLFLHHYFPALYFTFLLIGQYLDHQLTTRKYFGIVLVLSVVIGALYCFIHFIPIMYGTEWTFDQCNNSRWLSTWDINCMAYT
ncbi:Dolichyl-phosphate-mannose--protein mannosyltransferase 5 [Spathaspora sp. JA1]|nr:Dolichyl-phosphate-mannose--protein mannosyltransferase 5 [Spathaspora sp. JA1]